VTVVVDLVSDRTLRTRSSSSSGATRVGRFISRADTSGTVIRAVGFDLDETLAIPERDRSTLLAEAIRAVGAADLLADLTRESYLRAHREHSGDRTREPVFAALVEEHTDDEGGVDPADLAAAYRRAVEDALVPVEGAAGLVGTLRRSYRVGLLTDGPARTQRGKLETLGWTDLFDAVVVTGELPEPKPDPRTFRRLLRELGVDPDQAVFVGDHPEADVAGAANAGLHAVQVCYPGGPDPHPDANATVERDELVERLPGLLEEF
jgi:putative hydrolase of the HAD superfamily